MSGISYPNTINITNTGTGTSGSSYTLNYPTSVTGWTNSITHNLTQTATGQLNLTGESADIVINGQSLNQTLQTIQDRLAILVPDPEKLEKFEALRQAYEHYKTLEALCCEETTPKADK